jgi:hypothetical protein
VFDGVWFWGGSCEGLCSLKLLGDEDYYVVAANDDGGFC